MVTCVTSNARAMQPADVATMQHADVPQNASLRAGIDVHMDECECAL